MSASLPALLAAGAFIVLALAHSALGESDILRPLFAVDWEISEPRWAVERILRFAWHLTSVAWLGFAAITLGASPLTAAGIVSLVSGTVIFMMLRGHLAWPIFVLGGLAALHASQPLPDGLLAAGSLATVVILGAAAVLHVFWAFGGKWGLEQASPELPGNAEFKPGPLLTFAVAVALAVGASLVALVAGGADFTLMRWAVIGVVAVFTLRAVGDNRVAGFTKKTRDTDFAQADDRIFTPLCVFLALGATAALML